MKLISLVIFKNEKQLLSGFMNNLSQHVDAIVGYDDGSEDSSLFDFVSHKGIIAETKAKLSFSNGGQDEIRQIVLEKGRELGGTHFIILDIDERLYCSDKVFFLQSLKQLKPGQKVALDWVNLWNSYDEYCIQGYPLEPRKKAFIFRDHPQMKYPFGVKHKDIFHFDRLPNMKNAEKWMPMDSEKAVVLHLQHLNLDRIKIKKIWYQVLELIANPYSAVHINNLYKDGTPEDFATAPTKKVWRDVFLSEINEYSVENDWRYIETLHKIDIHGIQFFEKLDIWKFEKFEELWNEKMKRFPKIASRYDPIDFIKWKIELFLRRISK